MQNIRNISNRIKEKRLKCSTKLLIYLIDKKENNAFANKIFLFLKGKRKIVAFYMECHLDVYRDKLFLKKEFRKKYWSLGIQSIDNLITIYGQPIFAENIWKSVDVFIYNPGVPVRENIISLNNALTLLREDCEKISVTNAAFKGYMPQHTDRAPKQKDLFCWGDKNINSIIEDNKNKENLMNLSKLDFYDNEYVNHCYDKSLDQLEKIEKKCTVGICDYIREFGKKRILVNSVTHPSDEVMTEIARRLAIKLGINESIVYYSKNKINLQTHEEAVYPSVAFALGISENEYMNRRINPGDYSNSYSFEEYIQKYFDAKESEVL